MNARTRGISNEEILESAASVANAEAVRPTRCWCLGCAPGSVFFPTHRKMLRRDALGSDGDRGQGIEVVTKGQQPSCK
jgi:hypothetical protein